MRRTSPPTGLPTSLIVRPSRGAGACPFRYAEHEVEQVLDRPAVDEDGLLRHAGRWIAISDAQLPIVTLLVGQFGRVVRDAELVAAYAEAGCNGTRASMRSLVHRVGVRVSEVGLELRSIRGRGVLLEVVPGHVDATRR